jgi:hypothetical protein
MRRSFTSNELKRLQELAEAGHRGRVISATGRVGLARMAAKRDDDRSKSPLPTLSKDRGLTGQTSHFSGLYSRDTVKLTNKIFVELRAHIQQDLIGGLS